MRTKSSFYNFIVKLITSLAPSILGIVLNNLIITTYGSDVNGVTATIMQIINLLMLFEGGFTLATQVALYKPYLENDYDKINKIMAATKSIFLRLGFFVTIISIILAFAAPYFIKSDIDKYVISILLLIASAHTSIQFLFTLKYYIMFSVGQKEYKSSAVSLVFNILTQIISIVVILIGGSIISVKLVALIIPLLGLPILIRMFHKYFPNINFSSKEPDYSVIKTTKDVLAQKIAGLIFGSTDIIIISVVINTLVASVYAVYNMIFSFLKGILFSLILAPFHAFGQLYAENGVNKLSNFYKIYQFVAIIFINIFLTTALILILPFIELYTRGVEDVNYINSITAILFASCCFLELLSNILGSLSNSIGDFIPMKKITFIGTIVNIVVSVTLVFSFGINGVLMGTVMGYLVMNTLQIILVHVKTLKTGLFELVKLILVN
ncbi:MAG: polysaccharide biosynthesis C-terminal domain-containing protein, partial [Bacilli bacterium]|nr:polysaccharide biosynthesis C-terminal domain-containing protein [Bacilli bacterium]